jgi:RNA polymerase sigma factor (sigma-70 family)
MAQNASFDELMTRLRSGEDDAATAVFRRYAHRLAALAQRRFEPRLRTKADLEGVVQSALKSFFLRHEDGRFALEDWEGLWGLLVAITMHKCDKRRRYLRAGRRDARRDRSLDSDIGPARRLPLLDRAPSPVDVAMLEETIDRLLADLDPRDRAIMEGRLEGYSAEEVAIQNGCSERTVLRIWARMKQRLERLQQEELSFA